MPIKGSTFAGKFLQFYRKFQSVMKNVVWHYIVIAYHLTYTVCYITGVQTMRFAHFTGKRFKNALVPVGRFFYYVLDVVILKHIRSLFGKITGEAKRIAEGFAYAIRYIKEGFRENPRHACRFMLTLPFVAVRRHRKALFTLVNIAAPVAAVFVLVNTVNFWSSRTFVLVVEYDGQKLGYISDEAVYDAAATMASERVINTDNSFAVQRTPKLTIDYKPKSEILDEKSICDKILKSSSDSIAEVSGLYINGKFEGAMQSRGELDAILKMILNSYADTSKGDRAEFVQDVKVVDGLYPISSVVSADKMHDYLTKQTMVDKYYTVVKGDSPLLIAAKTDMSLAQLQSMNPEFDKLIFPDKKVLIQKAQPYLRVQVVRTVEYTEKIDYTSSKVEDKNQYIGYSKVKTEGQEGEQSVKAEITLLDGVEQSRKVLSKTVIKDPVNKVTVVGAKKVNPSVSVAGDGISTGRFCWPLPSCRMISSPYGYRWGRLHSGIDISGNGVFNKDIIAADGGTVVEVNTSGYGAGYGKYVIIDHGGGYRTLYAHCNAVLVSQGQKVSQGQLIAKVGETGNAYGAHLHFEVRINGRSANPTSYLR